MSLFTAQAPRGSFPSAGSITFGQVHIGGGGFMSGIDSTSDGTIVARTDVFGAYLLNTTTNTWKQLVTSETIPASYIFKGSTGAAEIKIAPSNTSIFYMYWVDTVFRSTNRGGTWNITNFSPVSFDGNASSKNQGPFIGIKPNDPNILLVSTQSSGVFRSTDGSNFSIVSAVGTGSGVGQIIAWDPNTIGTVYVGTSGTGVYKSTDSGVNWTLTSSGPTVFAHMHCAPDGTLFVADSTNAKVWVYNGTSWSSTTTSITPCDVAFDPTTSGSTLRIVIIDHSGQMQVSNNKGTSFSTAASPSYAFRTVPWLVNTFGFASDNCLTFDPTGQLFIGNGVGIWTTNPPAGTSYTATELTQGIENLVATQVISPVGFKPIFGVWDRMFFQVDSINYPTGGGPFNPLDTTIVGTWSLSASPNNQSFIAHLSNWNGTFDFSGYTSDGGVTWNQFSTLPSNSLSLAGGSIAVSSAPNVSTANIIIIQNGGPLYVTQDGGSTWTAPSIGGVSASGNPGWNNGGFFPPTQCVCADQVNLGTFYAKNFGNGASTAGLYRSLDGGVTWGTRHVGNLDGANDAGNTILGSVPGQAGNLYYTSGTAITSSGLPFWESTNGGSTWNQISNVTGVVAFGFGKAKPGTSYPAVYIVGTVGSVFGCWRSDDHCVTWALLTDYVNKTPDFVKTVSGDMNTYGTVYVGFAGSGYAYGKLT